MTLHPNEHEIVSSNKSKIILTNQRIQMNEKEWGRSHSITIFLENISSMQKLYKTNIFWIILAGLCLLFSVFSFLTRGDLYYDSSPFTISFVLGLIFLALWWSSRRHIISIHSDGGKPLEFSVKRMPDYFIEDFIDKVQLAKAQRIDELFKSLQYHE